MRVGKRGRGSSKVSVPSAQCGSTRGVKSKASGDGRIVVEQGCRVRGQVKACARFGDSARGLLLAIEIRSFRVCLVCILCFFLLCVRQVQAGE
jgi:hypothetical protein